MEGLIKIYRRYGQLAHKFYVAALLRIIIRFKPKGVVNGNLISKVNRWREAIPKGTLTDIYYRNKNSNLKENKNERLRKAN